MARRHIPATLGETREHQRQKKKNAHRKRHIKNCSQGRATIVLREHIFTFFPSATRKKKNWNWRNNWSGKMLETPCGLSVEFLSGLGLKSGLPSILGQQPNNPYHTDARHIGTYGKIVKLGTRAEIAHFVVHKGESLPSRVDLWVAALCGASDSATLHWQK